MRDHHVYHQQRKAMQAGDVSAIRSLLDGGMDVDFIAETVRGMTLLCHAASRGEIEICRLLIDRGANLEAASVIGARPLDYAARSTSPNSAKVAELLLSRGASYSARPDGVNVLADAAASGNFEVARLLIASGADVSVRDARGNTGLHRCSCSASDAIMRLLLTAGADPNAENEEQQTPLHWAVSADSMASLEKVALLVEFGADPDHMPEAPRSTYLTPFQSAIDASNASYARKLFELAGEDPSQLTVNGRSLTELARGRAFMHRLLRSFETECEVRAGIGADGSYAVPDRRFDAASPL